MKLLCFTLINIIFINYATGQKRVQSKPKIKYDNSEYVKLKQAEYKTCDSLNNIFDIDPCAILTLLQDSIYLHRKMYILCFYELIDKLKTKSGIYPNMTYGYNYGKEYSNFSLGKSLYKNDIIMWSRFFKCSDTLNLKAKRYGNLNELEYLYIYHYNEMIKVEKNYPVHIDTTIFD